MDEVEGQPVGLALCPVISSGTSLAAAPSPTERLTSPRICPQIQAFVTKQLTVTEVTAQGL